MVWFMNNKLNNYAFNFFFQWTCIGLFVLQDSASTPMNVTMWPLGHHFFRFHDVQFVILCFYFLYQMIELNLAANYKISNKFL